MNVGIPPVVLKASRNHTATLIFLHGLGDTGMGWAGALNSIKPDYLKVVCPTAPMLPVTLNGGASMPAWYDILSLDENDSKREDMEGVNWAVDFVHDLVRSEEKHGLGPERVVIGGFSQVIKKVSIIDDLNIRMHFRAEQCLYELLLNFPALLLVALL